MKLSNEEATLHVMFLCYVHQNKVIVNNRFLNTQIETYAPSSLGNNAEKGERYIRNC